MSKLILTLFSDNNYIEPLKRKLKIDVLPVNFRNFPDNESYIQFKQSVKGKEIILFDSLNNPNNKILPMIFVAELAKDLGATKVGLVAPYLAYMRQDKSFKEHEAITSKYFSKLICSYFDWLITVAPHLHRYNSLDEIYSIPNIALKSTTVISKWIQDNVTNPVLIGPDIESKQNLKEIADILNAPYIHFNKIRHGDYDIELDDKDLKQYAQHTPVLVDDIISTGKTLLGAIDYLKSQINTPPICIGVHAIFVNDSYEKLMKSGVSKVITCDSIPHPSNEISLLDTITEAIKAF